MADILEKDLEKYDRQIRLFGIETQSKLVNTKIAILQSSTPSLVSGEILKNILLLGVNEIYCDQETISSFKKICPTSFKEINKNVNLEIIKKEEILKNEFTNCFVIFVDEAPKLVGINYFFICSSCLSYHNTLQVHSVCNKAKDDLAAVKECMVGSFFVNDLVNFLRGTDFEGFTFPEL